MSNVSTSSNVSNASATASMPDIIRVLFQVQVAIKMFHWQTRSFSAHAAMSELHDDVLKYSDELIEQYMGVYGRPRMTPNSTIAIPNVSKSDMTSLLKQTIEFLATAVPRDTHLQNVRDELTSAMAKALYMLTQK